MWIQIYIGVLILIQISASEGKMIFFVYLII